MISALILTKNNEKLIERLINNLKLVCKEIVIVDTGSNDETVDIARKCGAQVYNYKFAGDFSAARNFGIEKARGDWMLSIDSDELLSDELINIIPNLVRNQKYDGYWVGCKTYISKSRYLKHGLFYPDRHLRLFRRTHLYRFSGQVHEQLNIPKNKTQDVEIGIDILHYPQNPKYTRFSDFPNMYPYIRIQARQIVIQNRNVFVLFYLGIYNFFRLFLSGFIRGKGFLDGWIGFRAHILFASSIACGYFLAIFHKFIDSPFLSNSS